MNSNVLTFIFTIPPTDSYTIDLYYTLYNISAYTPNQKPNSQASGARLHYFYEIALRGSRKHFDLATPIRRTYLYKTKSSTTSTSMLPYSALAILHLPIKLVSVSIKPLKGDSRSDDAQRK